MTDIGKILSQMGDMYAFDKSSFDGLNALVNQTIQAAQEKELSEAELEHIAAAQKAPAADMQKPSK